MNIIDFDILDELFNKPYVSQRLLSETTGYSLGKVNQSLSELKKAGYLSETNSITETAIKLAETNKPQNAIILAAGTGMRTYPLNRIVSKGLLQINNEVLIERLIKQLQEKGINDITVVVGFMKESYDYLIDKYGVKLVVNTEYEKKNNLHSLNLVVDKIANTYILPCDVWCKENPFSTRELYSWFMITDAMDENSSIRINRKQELVEIDTEEKGNKMIGISYLTSKDSEYLCHNLQEMDKKRKYSGTFWEEALFNGEKMSVWARTVPHENIIEINSFQQLKDQENPPDTLSSPTLEYIEDILSCKKEDIKDIFLLKNGTTNRTMHFSLNSKEYAIRIQNTDNVAAIDRNTEKATYEILKNQDIADNIISLDTEKGYKLSSFIPSSHPCNPRDKNEVMRCIGFLKTIHNKGLKSAHIIDLYKNLETYESLRKGNSLYCDYEETKRNVYKLKPLLEIDKDNLVLCHGEAYGDNFLITDSRIYLIDWENAGMQDPALDIAMTAIYSMYSKNETDALIDFYYDNHCSNEQRRKVYAFMAVGGLMWSNWCEYKTEQGIEFGEYAMKQYRYAKDYYRYAISCKAPISE